MKHSTLRRKGGREDKREGGERVGGEREGGREPRRAAVRLERND